MRDLINLNSLTDIISNSIGVLVLFSTLTLMQLGQKVYKVEVPLEYATEKGPVFFVCRDDAILPLDLSKIAPLVAGLVSEKPMKEPVPIDYHGYRGALDMEGSRGVVLVPGETEGWPTGPDLGTEGSALRTALDNIDPARQYGYFFVYDEPDETGMSGSGFESFRRAREYLADHHVESGWRPAGDEYPPFICFWSNFRWCTYDPMQEGGAEGEQQK